MLGTTNRVGPKCYRTGNTDNNHILKYLFEYSEGFKNRGDNNAIEIIIFIILIGVFLILNH